MKLSIDWLREWVDTGDDYSALAHALTMAGFEVEAIEPVLSVPMSGVVVGEVLSVEKHPDAEKLSVCKVESGRGVVQIVCGATNVRAGLKAPLATVGAVLPSGTQIGKAKLRGVESFGMLCSAKEVGLAEESSGLLELPTEFRTGADLVAELRLDDRVFEINLTPNRGDCMSVLGMAREVAAIRGVALRPPFDAGRPDTGPSISSPSKPPTNAVGKALGALLETLPIPAVPAPIQDTFDVRLEAGSACPKFVGRVIRGVRPEAKSPLWLRERLRRSGIRPISAVVDVTNFVMLELGQPMHAYDLRSLSGAIAVRFARDGEALTLLDGRTVTLTPDVMVIADEEKTLGMAGVMGGAGSGIGDDTTDVFLEVAYFAPHAIAGRGRRYGLTTDASQRFERGVDPRLQEKAMERATALILQIAGGGAGPSITTGDGAEAAKRLPVTLREDRLQRLLGAEIKSNEIIALLSKIGFSFNLAATPEFAAATPEFNAMANPAVVKVSSVGTLPEGMLPDGAVAAELAALPGSVSVPSWRFDVHIEEDLIEEVARLYGFDRIPEANAGMPQRILPAPDGRIDAAKLADLLADRGYFEAVTYSFTSPDLQRRLFPDREGLALTNPISADLAVMRVSLWPGLVQALSENQRRQQGRVRLFEMGRVFAAGDGAEGAVVGGIAAGRNVPEQWSVGKADVDFYDVKADVEALLALSAADKDITFVKAEHPALHPGQTAKILRRGRPVGWLGALHPAVVGGLGLTYGAIVFELELEAISTTSVPQLREISKFPGIRRDLAVVVNRTVEFAELESRVREAAGGRLNELTVFDVYQGTAIENDKKSIALGLHLQDTSRTLTDAEADAILAQVTECLRTKLQATIRDK